jgi:potassium channel subfamily K
VHGEGVRNPDTGGMSMLPQLSLYQKFIQEMLITNTLPVVHHDHRKIHQNLPQDEKLTHDDLLFELAREIRELLPRLSDCKNRKYTYEEWTEYIHLLNHDASKKYHFSTDSWSWLDDDSLLFRDKNETG